MNIIILINHLQIFLLFFLIFFLYITQIILCFLNFFLIGAIFLRLILLFVGWIIRGDSIISLGLRYSFRIKKINWALNFVKHKRAIFKVEPGHKWTYLSEDGFGFFQKITVLNFSFGIFKRFDHNKMRVEIFNLILERGVILLVRHLIMKIKIKFWMFWVNFIWVYKIVDWINGIK